MKTTLLCPPRCRAAKWKFRPSCLCAPVPDQTPSHLLESRIHRRYLSRTWRCVGFGRAGCGELLRLGHGVDRVLSVLWCDRVACQLGTMVWERAKCVDMYEKLVISVHGWFCAF